MDVEKKVRFSKYEQVFYIPNKKQKDDIYMLSDRRNPVIKKRKNKIKKEVKKTKKRIGRFFLLLGVVIALIFVAEKFDD